MKEEIKKVTEYFKSQNEKLADKIFDQEQMVDNIKCIIEELQDHISIIKKDITRESSIFYPADIKGKLNDKMESLISKKNEYETEFQLLNKNLNDLKIEYESNLKMKNTFNQLKTIAYEKQIQSEKNNSEVIESIIEKIKLCQSFIDIDRERCKLELDNIIRTYESDFNVSRETLK